MVLTTENQGCSMAAFLKADARLLTILASTGHFLICSKVIVGRLFMVDLAGSERMKKSGKSPLAICTNLFLVCCK